MIELDKGSYGSIYNLYQSNKSFFPLIAAVLLEEQDGIVYVDDYPATSQAYVEHAFGFAQIFGKTVNLFEDNLKSYLFTEKQFAPNKIRLYAPYIPYFLVSPPQDAQLSYRQRFKLPDELLCSHHFNDDRVDYVRSCSVNADNVHLIDSAFQVVSRFWRSPFDFIEKSNAIVVLYKGEPASICYAAAQADRYVEIDVLTVPAYRKMGLAKFAVIEFINKCLDLSLHPMWDCFTNNAGSMMLCKAVGFTAVSPPYHFFTIAK
jgi:hypothetical protein